MSQANGIPKWLSAINVADGSVVRPDANGWVSLAAATYVFVVRTSDQRSESFNIVTDATIAWSGLTIEDTNAPRQDSGISTPGTVTDWDNSADTTWAKNDSTSAGYVSSSGTGWTVTNLTLVKTAGKGAATVHLHSNAASRNRAKVVVTTPGTMRVAVNGKS